MLPRLLLKDWILNRRAILQVLAIFAAFQIYMVLRVDHTRPWIVFTAIYATFLTIVPLTREDKFRTVAWTCTLPVSRAEQMGARFAGSWLIVAAAYAVALTLAALLPGSRIAPAQAVDPDALLMAASVVSGILVILLPFTVRYGFMGVLLFLVALQILGVVVLLLHVATGGMLHVESGVISAFKLVGARIRASREALPPPVFMLAAVAGLAAVNWAGYRLAVALFRRREL